MTEETINLGKFIKGLNTVVKDTSMPEGTLRKAKNIDFDDFGNFRMRKGYKKIYDGRDVRSVYNRYFAEGNTLKYLSDDNTSVSLAYVEPIRDINFCEINNKIYYTDGKRNGVLNGLKHSTLGIKEPIGVPNAAPTYGSLEAGRYLMTIAYRDLLTGETSGCPNTAPGNVSQNTGVRFFNIPQPVSDKYETVIYMSNYNGTVLYEQLSVPFGITSVDVPSIKTDKSNCTTLNFKQMPAGQFIEYYKGKMYVADGSTLWYSKAMSYGLCRMATNFFSFPARITVLIAVNDGLFIVADRTYLLSFDKTEESGLVELSHDTAVEGTAISIAGSKFGLDTELDVAFWVGSKGAVMGVPGSVKGGPIIDITKASLAIKDMTEQKGSSMYTEYNGINKVVSSIGTPGYPEAKLAAQDSATLTIIRNGVEIQ